jgi:hypothetical protein
MPFRGFQDFVTPEDERAELEKMHRHLRVGGRIALDVFNPSIRYNRLATLRDATSESTSHTNYPTPSVLATIQVDE